MTARIPCYVTFFWTQVGVPFCFACSAFFAETFIAKSKPAPSVYLYLKKNEHIMPCFAVIAKDAKQAKRKNWEEPGILAIQEERESDTGRLVAAL